MPPSSATVDRCISFFFTFYYTAIGFNPTQAAESLRKRGGFIPGIRPGERTADYIDYVLSRITGIGAAYLAVVCVLPELLLRDAGLPFHFRGSALLIVVVGTHEARQLLAHLFRHEHSRGTEAIRG